MDPENQDLENGGAAAPTGDGQPGNKADEGEETVSLKKSELERLKSDLENYKTATLNGKAKDRELGVPKNEAVVPVVPSALDAEEIKRIAKEASSEALGQLEKRNQNKAKLSFLKAHPEYVDDDQWKDLMTGFSARRGNFDAEDVSADLEEAVVLHKHRTGKLDEYMIQQRDAGRREGELNASMNMGYGAGGVGDNGGMPGGNEGKVTQGLQTMAEGFRHDPKKVAKISPEKDSVINIFAK